MKKVALIVNHKNKKKDSLKATKKCRRKIIQVGLSPPKKIKTLPQFGQRHNIEETKKKQE